MNIYAGFWKRLLAHIIDLTILRFSVFLLVILFSLIRLSLLSVFVKIVPQNSIGPFSSLVNADENSLYALQLLLIVYFWLYYAVMESSKIQATVGKLALGIVVVDKNYTRLSFSRAAGRSLSRILSAFTFAIGFLMVGLTEKKQGLHDKLAQTYVVNKSSLLHMKSGEFNELSEDRPLGAFQFPDQSMMNKKII